MHRIIAGATGLVGNKLVAHWLDQKHKITVIGRNKKKMFSQFDNRVQVVEWPDVTPELFADAEVVVNLAGAGIAEKRWSSARKKVIVDSRVETTKKLVSILEIMGENSPPLFNASAIGVYGLQPQGLSLPERLDENTVIDFNAAPDFLALVGREWEKATQPAKDRGVRVVNLRFAVVLAKEGGALPMLARPFYFYAGGEIGSGLQVVSWVALADLIRAIDFLLPRVDVSGPVNIVAPESVRQREFAGRVQGRYCIDRLFCVCLRRY